MSNESIISGQRKVDEAMEAIKPKAPVEGILVQIRITPENRTVNFTDEDGVQDSYTEEKFKMHLHLDTDLFKQIKSKGQVLELYDCIHTIRTNVMLQDGTINEKALSEKGIVQLNPKSKG